MVVIVIIGMLASVVTVGVMGHLAKARVTTTEAQVKEFTKALDLYKMDTGSYPTSSQGLKILTDAKKGTEPYLVQIPNDAWGNPYRYRSLGATYDIISYGADGREGGEGYDADIKSSTLGQKQK
jgi:general secretion pathway protein G